jgi:hypothetical protein
VFEFRIGVVTVAPFGKPPDQVYVLAPDAVMVADVPIHIPGELTATVGNGLTVTLATAVLVQPFAAVPVTV